VAGGRDDARVTLSAADVRRSLQLRPLPVEGGEFAVVHADAHASAIHYLLEAPDFSALHVLESAETYHHYAGAPLRMLWLWPDGRVDEPVLGTDLAAGQRPQLRVPPGVVQGSSVLTGPGADWALVGTTMAPPYRDDGVRFPTRDELVERWPAARERIGELTRLG
jgi:predicted cupin superfamily sugar epimerase